MERFIIINMGGLYKFHGASFALGTAVLRLCICKKMYEINNMKYIQKQEYNVVRERMNVNCNWDIKTYASYSTIYCK